MIHNTWKTWRFIHSRKSQLATQFTVEHHCQIKNKQKISKSHRPLNPQWFQKTSSIYVLNNGRADSWEFVPVLDNPHLSITIRTMSEDRTNILEKKPMFFSFFTKLIVELILGNLYSTWQHKATVQIPKNQLHNYFCKKGKIHEIFYYCMWGGYGS